MPKVEITGLDELIRKVEKMGKKPDGLAKRAIYSGVGVMADAMRSAVNSIPIDNTYGTKSHKKAGLTSEEKASLATRSAMGISKMESGSGRVTVAIGFHGTNANGLKNSTVMRRVESGTSIMEKRPTIRPAVNKTKAAAFQAMQKQFEKDVKEAFE